MHTLFIDLYKRIEYQINQDKDNTHHIPNESKYDLTKEECKREIRKALNSNPEDLEPLYSRMAKCKAIKDRTFDVHVFDETTDKIFTNIWEFNNGQYENGFSGLSFLVEFQEGSSSLSESVYVRIAQDECVYVYDMKPCNIVDYSKNKDTTEDDSNWGKFKKAHPDYAKYIERWEKSDKNLCEELSKWEDMLWLGRHLYHVTNGDIDNWNPEIKKGALEAAERIINEYKDDPDFIKYMSSKDGAEPDDEFGDTYWKEISCNVGALRYILIGEWYLDS